MEKQKVILDVDTGTDDAVAIMLAALSKDLDLLGVCSVNGNRGTGIRMMSPSEAIRVSMSQNTACSFWGWMVEGGSST